MGVLFVSISLDPSVSSLAALVLGGRGGNMGRGRSPRTISGLLILLPVATRPLRSEGVYGGTLERLFLSPFTVGGGLGLAGMATLLLRGTSTTRGLAITIVLRCSVPGNGCRSEASQDEVPGCLRTNTHIS